ncbi:potassium-transporting ATPase subunit KdpA [Parabacteroides sp. FAFU027]|uniref:potassium-transporting ATPase subunit KdpA n=1 Tax=Parabacteroides sp. FAFU027 TaxID=2922715 RepID=UPI001FAE804D|nr:potassium-transporting ATPase subunit KdpA [Parabacteroides sp. FAFU027]
MNYFDVIQLTLYIVALVVLTPITGKFMANVFENKPFKGKKAFLWAEKSIYKICDIDPEKQMDWKKYTFALLFFNLTGFLVVFLLQLFQQHLGLNPQHQKNVEGTLAFNTAVSFMTNTNWQSYSGENTMSYLTQMLGLAVQNFVSAATGITVILALIRGLRNRTSENLGNFFADLTRSVVYVLLPLSIVFAVFLVSQGVVQNFSHYSEVTTLEGAKQILPQGPAASQIAIKQLGTNGGGFFGANSAHPFENPTPLCNFLEMLAILLLPAGLTFTYGKMVGSVRQGWILFTTMLILFLVGQAITTYSEFSFAGHIMEGKETRFGILNSVLWENATTAASNGSVNAMHSSLSPLSGMVALFNMMLGEIIFGGVGAGLYGMLVFVILTVFIAGLMVGRTPEYLGKKIESFEMKMAIIGVVLPSFVILTFTAIAVLIPAGLNSIANKGPHGFSEILYAFTSAAGNNGSAFAGLSTNTPFYNIMIGIGMLIGRFGIILPVLAIAGSLSRKKIVPVSAGTFQTDNMTFVFLLISIILIVGALTFFPALSLGPIIEHILMLSGKTF